MADDDFRNDDVDAGEIGAGHSVTALYEIKLAQGESDPQAPVATVRLRWEDPQNAQVSELTGHTRVADISTRLRVRSRQLPARRDRGRVCRKSARQRMGSRLAGRGSGRGRAASVTCWPIKGRDLAEVTELVDLVGWVAAEMKTAQALQ